MLLVILTALTAGPFGVIGAISLFAYRFENEQYYEIYGLISICSGIALLIFTIVCFAAKSPLASSALACLIFSAVVCFLSFAMALPILI